MKKVFGVAVAVAFLMLSLSLATAEPAQLTHDPNKVCIIVFYGEGCPACAAAKPFLQELEQKYASQANFQWLEIYRNIENYKLFSQYCSIKNIPIEQRGIPTVAAGADYLIGIDQIKQKLETIILSEIAKPEKVCPLPESMPCHINQTATAGSGTSPAILGFSGISWPLVLTAGVIDSINPCAFAVLVFLMTYLLATFSDKKRMLVSGLVYIAVVYLTYLTAGLGILEFVRIAGASLIFYYVAGVLAIAAGLINLKDFFWYGKGITLRIPQSRKPTIRKWVERASLPAAIVLGFLVALFELPCTGGIYLAILAMLASNGEALLYLIVYNIMFVLPLVLILLFVYFGLRVEQVKAFKESKKNWMKLAMGIFLLLLGAVMLLR